MNQATTPAASPATGAEKLRRQLAVVKNSIHRLESRMESNRKHTANMARDMDELEALAADLRAQLAGYREDRP